MRFAPIYFVLLAALTLAATQGAAAAAKDPKTLALSEPDFPAHAERMAGTSLTSAKLARFFGGAKGDAYVTTFRFRNGQRLEYVEDVVVVCRTTAEARSTFAALKSEELQHPGPRTAARLPSYGEEQAAAVVGNAQVAETAPWLVVRKGLVVWVLDIDTDATAKVFGLSRAQSLAEITKYAARQKKRVGND